MWREVTSHSFDARKYKGHSKLDMPLVNVFRESEL